MWLQSSIRKLQCLEYFKVVFLKIQNVQFQMVFINPVTYVMYVYVTRSVKRVLYTQLEIPTLYLENAWCLFYAIIHKSVVIYNGLHHFRQLFTNITSAYIRVVGWRWWVATVVAGETRVKYSHTSKWVL